MVETVLRCCRLGREGTLGEEPKPVPITNHAALKHKVDSFTNDVFLTTRVVLIEPVKGQGVLVSAGDAEQVTVPCVTFIRVRDESGEVVLQHCMSEREVFVHGVHNAFRLGWISFGILLKSRLPLANTTLFILKSAIQSHHHTQEQIAPTPNTALLPGGLRTEPSILVLIIDDIVQELLGLSLEAIIIQGEGKRYDTVEPVSGGFAEITVLPRSTNP